MCPDLPACALQRAFVQNSLNWDDFHIPTINPATGIKQVEPQLAFFLLFHRLLDLITYPSHYHLVMAIL